ncbi:hypothetical protein BC936DRAFT_147733 [Jimgerdemannia flammicorona]|uniref:Uncharacterized protein n=1 Tax=Jimgerdemannia flammicorona TaxID=994334 RepID=A0A433DKW5_9FUNG|nr:hypothetical protein BC936DRAFT_147733 [Jimgerdemannia flammicorona]
MLSKIVPDLTCQRRDRRWQSRRRRPCRRRAQVLRVGDRGRLPLAIHVIVPVLRFDSVWVRNELRDVVVALGLLVLWVDDPGLFHPVSGFGRVGVLDLQGREDVPVLDETARALFLAVDQNAVGLIGFDDQSVDVREGVGGSRDGLLVVVVRALVVEDDVHQVLGATQVGAEHDVVFRVAIEGLSVKLGGIELEVATATVDLLLVLHAELGDEVLVSIVEGLLQRGGQGVEAVVLGGLKTDQLLLVGEPLAGA